MHIPDGFLDARTALTTTVLSTAGLGLALRRVRLDLPQREVPLLGLAAAFLFAAQMVNFPVVGGTSGHLVGGALVAVLLGPAAGVVVVATVLIVQSLLFADGGVTALGANVFNMGIVATVGGSLVFGVVSRVLPGLRGRVAAMAFAGWCSVVLAAISCAGQLAWSGTVGWRMAFPAMAGIHALIGLGEGMVSALVFLAINRTRPDLMRNGGARRSASPVSEFVTLGALAALGIALFVAPFASPWPDGLDAVANRLGFAHQADASPWASPLANYHLPWFSTPGISTAIAGALGTLVVFGLAVVFARLIVAAPTSRAGDSS